MPKRRSPDQKKTGKNPTDRGKQGVKRSILTDARGVPLAIVVAEANIHDSKLLAITLSSIIVKRPSPKQVRQHLLADKAYADQATRKAVAKRGYEAHIPQKENARLRIPRKPGRRKSRRWVIERTFGNVNRARAVLVRWEKEPENYEALLHIAAAIICFKWSKRRRGGLLG